MPSPDLNAANFGLPQVLNQPLPTTIASAATIAPTGLVTLVTGAAAIATITPPLPGIHVLFLISSGGTFSFTAAGNILTAVAAVVAGEVCVAIFNPNTQKYSVGKLTLTSN